MPAAALLATFAALLLPGAALAEGPGLRFAEPDPTTLTWSAVERGAVLTLCNTTNAPVIPVFLVSGPEVGAGSRLVAELLAATTPGGPIGAGACGKVGLSLTGSGSDNPPRTESTTAELTAVAPGVGSTGLSIRILPDVGPTLLGSFGDVTLTATRSNPWSGSATLDDPALWLRYSGTPAPVDPQGVLVVEGSRRATLQLGGGQLAVDGGLRVPLTLTGANRPGTYHGTLELGGQHGSIPVAVAVVVADAVWVLLLLVLVGVLVALLLRVATGKWRYRLRLWQARRRVRKGYAAGRALGPELAERFPVPTDVAVEAWRAEARSAGRAYFRTVLTVDVADPTYVSVCADVSQVLADCECLQRTFAPAVGGLEHAVARLGEFLDAALPSLDDPDVVDVARALLRVDTTRPPLQVKEASKVRDLAGRLTETVAAWQAEAEVVLRHMRWSRRLAHGAEFPEQLQLAAANDALGRAIRELFDSTTTASVGAVAHGADVREAHRLLATVGARRGVWLEDDLGGPLADPVDGAFTDLMPERVAHPELRSTLRAQRWSGAPLAATTFRVTHEYVPVVAGALASVLVTFAGAVVAFGAAAFVAYQVLYAGRPFGSGPDLLAAVFAGVAAGAVVDALVNGVNWSRGGLRSLKA